jgi:hypothetical protein
MSLLSCAGEQITLQGAKLMKQIQVECYAGGRADERPRRVVIDGRDQFIAKVLKSSVEESVASKERIRRFTVLTEEGIRLKIFQAAGEWYLETH